VAALRDDSCLHAADTLRCFGMYGNRKKDALCCYMSVTNVFQDRNGYYQGEGHVFTKKLVQDMVEKDLRQQVLVPLLRAMKLQGVHEYHGTTEFGKDIVCWSADELKNRQNLALVVKATAVSGKSNASADIQNQVRQCFGKPYIDPITSVEECIDRCWVVSNKPISHEAVDLIKAGIGHAVYERNVRFLGIDQLWELIEKHMPFQASFQKLEEVRHDFETWDTHYRLEAQVDGTGIHSILAEKFPGAAQEKPLTIHSTFEFPDTEDGRKYVEALSHFYETGAPIKIPAMYIKNLEYSNALQQVLPPMGDDGFLQISPIPHPKPLLLRCEIMCDDGDRFEIEYIHLTRTRGGQKEVTFTNENQPIPFKIEQVIHFDGSQSSFHISIDHTTSWNVHQQLLHMKFVRCMSKTYTMRFTNLETGMSMAASRNKAGVCEAPHEELLEMLAALDALQMKSGKSVYFPDRDLTDEECQDIAMLRMLFRTGKIGASWRRGSASMIITNEDRTEQAQMLQRFADGEGFYCLSQGEVLLLFGQAYSLGPIKPLSLPIVLENWSDIKTLLDTGYCGEAKLEFVPCDDGSFTKEYVNWLPENSDMPALDADDASSDG
jgi:hypothetical protein